MTQGLLRRWLLLLLLLPSGCMAQPGPSSGTLKRKPCRIAGAESAWCGVHQVPEDRSVQGGRMLDLHIVILPARQDPAAGGPLFFLHGGPGAAATLLAPFFEHSRWREQRDIVLVDQRGTGKSAPLDCPRESLEDLLDELATFAVPRVDKCREGVDASLSHYTTSAAVADLEEIRKALGAPRVNLLGGSYGTRVALEYLRRYPDSVRTATLRGVAPPSFSLPSEFDHDSMEALERVLADCTADVDCARSFPRLQEELDQVLRRLENTSGTARVKADGKIARITVTRELFAAGLHYALYTSDTSARIPLWIHQASEDDFDDLLESTVRFARALAPHLYMGAFLSVACAEDAPFYDAAEVVAAAKGTLLRGRFSVTLSENCSRWQVEPVPVAFKEPVRSKVPVLLISGETDPVTPPRVAREAARHLDRSLHLVLKGTGHSELTPGCLPEIVERFLRSGAVEGLDTACTGSIRRPEFVLKP